MDQSSLYDSDILAWSEQQAAALRGLMGKRRQLPNELDLENVAEEIEDVGKAALKGVASLIRQILVHLIKAASSSNSQLIKGWRQEVIVFHGDLLDDISPAMKSRIDMGALWKRALREAEAAMDVHGESSLPAMPVECPVSLTELLDPEFNFLQAVETAKALDAA